LGSEIASNCTLEEDTECVLCGSGFAGLGNQERCELCDGEREYTDGDGHAVCKQSSPGEMPTEDHTGVEECPEDTDLEGCVCPKNTFLTLERDRCEKFADEGVDLSDEGMTLEMLRLLPGYWRTNNRSSDVRPCPVAEACTGWTNASASYCRGGHTGPYCNLCAEGFSKDAFGLCQPCGEGGEIWSKVGGIVAVVVMFAVGYWLLNKTVFKKNPRIKRSLKTGMRILIVSVSARVHPSEASAPERKERTRAHTSEASAREGGYSGARSLPPPAPLAQEKGVVRALARYPCPLRSHKRRGLFGSSLATPARSARTREVGGARPLSCTCTHRARTQFQILASLPTIVPAIQLPEAYLESLEKLSVVNLSFFQGWGNIGIQCLTAGNFNQNWVLVGTTATPFVICAVFRLLGLHDAAIAVVFLVLPAVTTTIFQSFPCDSLDSGEQYVRAI
jgi:hypothetical protein